MVINNALMVRIGCREFRSPTEYYSAVLKEVI